MNFTEFRLIIGGIVVLALIVDVYGFLRFVPTIGLPWWAAVACVIPIKAVEWRFLTLAHRLSTIGWTGKLLSVVPVVVWLAAVGLSATAVHSTIHSMQESADLSVAKKRETRTNLKATLASVEAQLATLSKPSAPRPPRSVQEALGWVALPPLVRRATDDCRRVEQDDYRRACKEVLNLRKELAASLDYEDLRRATEGLRAQLAGLEISPSGDSMGRSFELIYGAMLKIDGKAGIALTVMLILTLVSALGPFCLDFLSSRQGHTLRRVAIRRQVRVPGSIARPLEHVRKSAHLTLADNGSARGQPRANPGDKAAQRPPGRQEKAPAQGQTGTCPPSSSEGRCQESPTRAPQDVASARAQADTCPPNLATLPEIARQFRPTRKVASGEKPDAYLADPVACALNSSKPTRQQDSTPAQEEVATCRPTAAASLPDRGGDRSEDNPSQRLKLVPAHGQVDICLPNFCTLPEYVRQDRPARLLAEPSHHGHAVACSPVDGPGQGAGKEKADAGIRRRDGNNEQVHAGIEAFAAMLDWGLGVRAAGSELWLAYVAERERNSWPDLAPNVFGRLIKGAVEARGGWKRKSSSQFYEGVCVPLKLRTQMTAAVATGYTSSKSRAATEPSKGS